MASITSSPTAALSLAPSQPRTTRRGRYALLALGTVVASVLANVVVYYLGALVVGYNSGFIILANPSGVAMFTFFPAVVATLLYAALLRFTHRPERNFAVVSAIVFVATTIPDFTYIPTVPGATNSQTAILVLTHIVAATVIVGMLIKPSRPQAH
jgi:MFS family permease